MSTTTTTHVICPPCPVCGKSAVLEVPTAGLEAHKRGALTQEAFPELDRAQREMLITGTHPTCWDELFGEDEDPED